MVLKTLHAGARGNDDVRQAALARLGKLDQDALTVDERKAVVGAFHDGINVERDNGGVRQVAAAALGRPVPPAQEEAVLRVLYSEVDNRNVGPSSPSVMSESFGSGAGSALA